MFVETRKVWNIPVALMLLWRSVDKYNIPKKIGITSIAMGCNIQLMTELVLSNT